MTPQSANTEIIDPSLTFYQRLKLILFTVYLRMQTFTCSISKQNGAHSGKITIKQIESTPITGRTLDESLIFSNTKNLNVTTGDQLGILPSIPKAESLWRTAYTVTDGRRSYITRYPTKCIHAEKNKCLKSKRNECPFYHSKNERRFLKDIASIEMPILTNLKYNPNKVYAANVNNLRELQIIKQNEENYQAYLRYSQGYQLPQNSYYAFPVQNPPI